MIEAPEQEPRDVDRPGWRERRRGQPHVCHPARARFQALAGMTLARRRRRGGWRWWGPSGCGKTTLLELVCGLQAPDAGTVDAAPAALMPQRDMLLPWLGALDNACLALRGARRRTRTGHDVRRSRGSSGSGWGGFEADPGRRSCRAGMRQRVSFLRDAAGGQAGGSHSTSRSHRSTRSRACRCRGGSGTCSRPNRETVRAGHA